MVESGSWDVFIMVKVTERFCIWDVIVWSYSGAQKRQVCECQLRIADQNMHRE